MPDCVQIVTKYIRELHEDFEVVDREGDCLIVTPYLLPDSDSVEVLVRKKDGRYELSDMGTTLGFLYLSGVDLSGRSKQEAHFKANLAKFDVKVESGELRVNVSEPGLSDGIARLVEASKAIAYLVYTARTRPGLDFRKAVSEWLQENEVPIEFSTRIPGATGAFTVDFVRQRQDGVPAYMQALHSETRGWAKNVVNETIVMWFDIRETHRPFQAVSLLDDSVEEDVWTEHLSRLRHYSDHVAFWETKEELLELLVP